MPFYGRPQKYVRHVTDNSYVCEPQRGMIIPFWYADASVSAYSDGDDVSTLTCQLGSKITNHKVEMILKPETIEPQNTYLGVVKLSFHDIFSPYVCGKAHHDDAGYQDATPTITNYTSYLQMWPNTNTSKVANYPTGQLNFTLNNARLDDNFKHFVNSLKKIVVFDQQPLISNRKMKIPSKVKRINPYTFYGLWLYNDSARGATPADTQVTLNLKQYFEEYAI